jgi:hypothetical protein
MVGGREEDDLAIQGRGCSPQAEKRIVDEVVEIGRRYRRRPRTREREMGCVGMG